MRWLTSVASVTKSALNRPDLSSNQMARLGQPLYTRRSYTIFPFPHASSNPRRLSSRGGSQKRTRSIGSRDWTRTHEGILEERRGKKVGSIRLKNLVACSLCRFSICCFARERFQNPLTYTAGDIQREIRTRAHVDDKLVLCK